MKLIAYSSEKRDHLGAQLGTANYSYRFAEDALIRCVQQAGHATRYVAEPHIFKSEKAFRGLLGCDPSDVLHIAFRSTENIRPMSGATNVCHFAWEFDVLKNSGLATESVLENQAQMLSMMDEVWVACRYSKQILENFGISKTYVVPAPVVDDAIPARLNISECLDAIGIIPTLPLCLLGGATRDSNGAVVSQLVSALSDNAQIRAKLERVDVRIFLSVLNPGDLRKNLLNLIEGFQLAADAVGGNCLLLVKLIVPNKGDFRTFAQFDQILPRCNGTLAHFDSRVLFLVDYLSDSQMDALFSLADYYLSPTHCEGFNRPLLQAMSFGSVPISTMNTAMADYVDASNSIVIPERKFLGLIPGMAGDVSRTMYAITHADRFDIAGACVAAMRQSDASWQRMSERSQQTVLEKYGTKVILKLFEDRLNALARQKGRS